MKAAFTPLEVAHRLCYCTEKTKKEGVGVGEGCEVEIGKLRGRERKMLGNCGANAARERVAFRRHVNLEHAARRRQNI